jgi:hypothetical protein
VDKEAAAPAAPAKVEEQAAQATTTAPPADATPSKPEEAPAPKAENQQVKTEANKAAMSATSGPLEGE